MHWSCSRQFNSYGGHPSGVLGSSTAAGFTAAAFCCFGAMLGALQAASMHALQHVPPAGWAGAGGAHLDLLSLEVEIYRAIRRPASLEKQSLQLALDDVVV